MNKNKTDISNIIIEAIQDKKGSKITEINFSGIESAPVSKFYICTGRSTSQVSAIADRIRDSIFEKSGIKPYNYDGYRNSQWIVIDYGDVMVHVFLPEFREFYNLEDLWSDGKFREIPDLD